MEFLIDPTTWVGLFTLLMLEIVLGIDNIIFIAILADKLPLKKRERARIIGLSLALIMRLSLLSLISWIVTLTKPLFSIHSFLFSARDLILLSGGILLLFKATTELHERLENKEYNNRKNNNNRNYSSFWAIVIQIVLIDAVLSLDAVITAVGVVNDLPIMMFAVTVAMLVMLFASHSLTNFINCHQTVVVLCLSFLLMIGLSLIAEGFGFHIPKGYLYTSISFSILIELFNYIAHSNSIKKKQSSSKPTRERTAEAIIRLMNRYIQQQNINREKFPISLTSNNFIKKEHYIVSGVPSLASHTLHGIMTPRSKIFWLDCQKSVDELHAILVNSPYNIFPICDGKLDQLIGIVQAKNLIEIIRNGKSIRIYAANNPAIIVPETLDMVILLNKLRKAKYNIVLVSNEFGIIQGLITPLDILKIITN